MISVNAPNFLTFIYLLMTNIFYANKSLLDLECLINAELKLVDSWLCANELSLNTGKSCFVIFHPCQKNVPFSVQLTICNKTLKAEKYIQYLKWKEHVNYLMKKIERNVGLLSKVRYFVDLKTLISLYYALI